MDIFVIGCFPTPDRIPILRETIKKIKRFKLPIMLVSHYPVPQDIQESVEYVLFDKNNILSEDFIYFRWFGTDEISVTAMVLNNYHGAAVYTNMYNATAFVCDNFEWVHFIDHDVDISDSYISLVEEKKNSCKMVAFNQWASGYETHPNARYSLCAVFSFDSKWLKPNLRKIATWRDYMNISESFIWTEQERTFSGDKKRWDRGVLEIWLYKYFEVNGLLKDICILPYSSTGIMTSVFSTFLGQEEDQLKVVTFGETVDGKTIEFTWDEVKRTLSWKIRDKLPTDKFNATFKFRNNRFVCKGRWNGKLLVTEGSEK